MSRALDCLLMVLEGAALRLLVIGLFYSAAIVSFALSGPTQ